VPENIQSEHQPKIKQAHSLLTNLFWGALGSGIYPSDVLYVEQNQ
jgi:hypothetical protein